MKGFTHFSPPQVSSLLLQINVVKFLVQNADNGQQHSSSHCPDPGPKHVEDAHVENVTSLTGADCLNGSSN